MIEPCDEELHPIGDARHWQESYYFNWADPRHDVFGLTRIGFRFHERRIDGLVLTIRDGRPEYVYPAVNLAYRGSWDDTSVAQGLRARSLLYTLERPLSKWRISLTGNSAMELSWEAFTPPFDYHEAGGELPANVAGRHFEQSGRVTGWTRFKGREIEIQGLGQRDKSWGARDWANVEGWTWISAQFSQELAFNIWQGQHGGRRYSNGFFFRDGENRASQSTDLRFAWGRSKHVLRSAQIIATDMKGARYTIDCEALGHFPLVKRGLWIQETHVRVSTTLKGRRHQGIGVIEHAWRPGTLRLLSRVPHLMNTARKAIFR